MTIQRRKSGSIQKLVSDEGNQEAHLMTGVRAFKYRAEEQKMTLPSKVNSTARREESGMRAACRGKHSPQPRVTAVPICSCNMADFILPSWQSRQLPVLRWALRFPVQSICSHSTCFTSVGLGIKALGDTHPRPMTGFS